MHGATFFLVENVPHVMSFTRTFFSIQVFNILSCVLVPVFNFINDPLGFKWRSLHKNILLFSLEAMKIQLDNGMF